MVKRGQKRLGTWSWTFRCRRERSQPCSGEFVRFSPVFNFVYREHFHARNRQMLLSNGLLKINGNFRRTSRRANQSRGGCKFLLKKHCCEIFLPRVGARIHLLKMILEMMVYGNLILDWLQREEIYEYRSLTTRRHTNQIRVSSDKWNLSFPLFLFLSHARAGIIIAAPSRL